MYTTHSRHFSESFKNRVIKQIGAVREIQESRLKQLISSAKGEERAGVRLGSRFFEDEQVYQAFVMGFQLYKFKEPSIKKIVTQIEDLADHDIRFRLSDALRDVAKVDHYYEYEKLWH